MGIYIIRAIDLFLHGPSFNVDIGSHVSICSFFNLPTVMSLNWYSIRLQSDIINWCNRRIHDNGIVLLDRLIEFDKTHGFIGTRYEIVIYGLLSTNKEIRQLCKKKYTHYFNMFMRIDRTVIYDTDSNIKHGYVWGSLMLYYMTGNRLYINELLKKSNKSVSITYFEQFLAKMKVTWVLMFVNHNIQSELKTKNEKKRKSKKKNY